MGPLPLVSKIGFHPVYLHLVEPRIDILHDNYQNNQPAITNNQLQNNVVKVNQ